MAEKLNDFVDRVLELVDRELDEESGMDAGERAAYEDEARGEQADIDRQWSYDHPVIGR